MKLDKIVLLALSLSFSGMSNADDDNLTGDAAIGGGLGGAAGAAIGAELGGKDGAIIGSAAGAALGTAISTDGYEDRSRDRHDYRHGEYYAPPRGGHPRYRHCPPGQAKKGRC